MTTDDRRTSTRLPASIAGEMVTDEGRTSIAITRDVSAGGLLVLARRHVQVGQGVTIRLGHTDREFVLKGRIAREEPVPPEASHLWRTKLAIAVDQDDPELGELFLALAAAEA